MNHVPKTLLVLLFVLSQISFAEEVKKTDSEDTEIKEYDPFKMPDPTPNWQTQKMDSAGKGLYLGTGIGFGQTYSSEDNTSAGLGYHLGLDLGYVKELNSWSRIEIALALYFGAVGYSFDKEPKSTVDINLLGVMFDFGYAYSLGNGLFGIWKMGLGPVSGDYSQAFDSGIQVDSQNRGTGLAYQLGLYLVGPVMPHLDISGGLQLTQYNLSYSKLKTTKNGVTSESSDSISFKLLEAIVLSLRYSF